MLDNEQNKSFYVEMPEGIFESLGTLPVGFNEPIDVRLALSKLGFHPTSCLELGAGTGRVIDALITELNPLPKIIAVERVEKFAEHLTSRYADRPEISILAEDLLTCNLPTVELSLWMFSGMVEFNLAQQSEIVNRIAECTSKALVIDYPHVETKIDAARVEGNLFVKEAPYGPSLTVYIPTADEMNQIFKKSKFDSMESYSYLTLTNRERIQFIFRKNSSYADNNIIVDGSAIIQKTQLTFDPGDKANGSLYLCDPSNGDNSSFIAKAVAKLQDAGLWSGAPSKIVRDDQKDAYVAQLQFVEAVEFEVDGIKLFAARYDHSKFPSSAERFSRWKDLLMQRF